MTDVRDTYNKSLDLLESEEEALATQVAEKRKRYLKGAETETSLSQAAAKAAIAFLPALAGGLAGGYRGAAVGAKAGSVGVQRIASLEEKARARQEELMGTELSLAEKELSRKQAQRNSLQKQALSHDASLERMDISNENAINRLEIGTNLNFASNLELARQKQKEGLTNNRSEPVTPEYQESLRHRVDRMNLPAEMKSTLLADLQNARSRQAAEATMQEVRRTENARQQRLGGGPIPIAEVAKLEKRRNAIEQLDGLIGQVEGAQVDERGLQRLSAEYASALQAYAANNKVSIIDAARENPGLADSILARNAAAVNPNSATGIAFKEGRRIANEVALSRAGVATNQDVEREIEQLLISAVETKSTYVARLRRIAGYEKSAVAGFVTAIQNPTPAGLAERYGAMGYPVETPEAEKARIKAAIIRKMGGQ